MRLPEPCPEAQVSLTTPHYEKAVMAFRSSTSSLITGGDSRGTELEMSVSEAALLPVSRGRGAWGEAGCCVSWGDLGLPFVAKFDPLCRDSSACF